MADDCSAEPFDRLRVPSGAEGLTTKPMTKGMAQRILFLNPTGELGGAEISLLGLVRRLDRRLFEPQVLALSPGPFLEHLKAQGVPAETLPTSEHFLRLSWRGRRRSPARAAVGVVAGLPAVTRLARYVRQRHVALIHTNGIKAHLVGWLAGRMSRTPVIWHVRDFLGVGRQERVLLRIARSGPARIITNSHAVAEDLEQRGVSKEILCPIHNGVDLEEFSPAVDGDPFRRECGFEKATPLLGLVAMLAPWKGHLEFIEAAAQVAREFPEARFPIVGEEIYVTEGHGEFRQRLQDRITQVGAEGAVVLVGRRRNMPQVMAALDVVVHASSRPEPFGRVLIEAMASGKPVVATSAGGVPEIVTDGETGLLVPPGEPASLAAAMRRLLVDSSLRDRLGKAGRKAAESRFDLRTHVEQVHEVYLSVLARCDR